MSLKKLLISVAAPAAAFLATGPSEAQTLPGLSGPITVGSTGTTCTTGCSDPVIIPPETQTGNNNENNNNNNNANNNANTNNNSSNSNSSSTGTGVGVGIGQGGTGIGQGGAGGAGGAGGTGGTGTGTASATATGQGGKATIGDTSSTSGVNGNIGGTSAGNSTNVNLNSKTIFQRQNPGTSATYNVQCQGGGEVSTPVGSVKLSSRWEGCEATTLGSTLMQNSRFNDNCNQSYQMYYDGRMAAAAGNKKLAKVFTENMMPKSEWCAANVEVGYSTYTPPAPQAPVQPVYGAAVPGPVAPGVQAAPKPPGN